MIHGAVLGSPISHSLSPLLHNSAYDFLGLKGEYTAIDTPAGSLATFLSSHGGEFDYLSLTMPLKEEALSLNVKLDELTQRIQSANTLIKRNEQWSLTSTDGVGLIHALHHAGLDSFQSVLVLGAGGTARAVVGSLDAHSQRIEVVSRSSVREPALRSAISRADFVYSPWRFDINFSSYDLIINTTPAGAADTLTQVIEPGIRATLFDVIYKPWPTQLAARWADCGGRVINGLELLLYQGIEQIELAISEPIDRLTLSNHLRPILQRATR
jgi:shikimate dehydrogenase